MVRKIIYSVAAIVTLLVIIALFVPTPDQASVQESETAVEIEAATEKLSVPVPVEPNTPAQADGNKKTSRVLAEQKPPPQTTPPLQFYAVTDVIDGDTIQISLAL